jgi:uncharacterized membrane protein YqgA involved in biofilm formation
MPGLGVLVNVLAVLFGTGSGLVVGRFIPERMRTAVIQAQGIAVIVVGLLGAIPALERLAQAPAVAGRFALIIFVASLIIGTFIGEAIRIEARLTSFAVWLRAKFQAAASTDAKGKKDHALVEGFMTASLIYCVGAMTILGSLQDGLGHPDTLFVKALLDGTISLFLASSLGGGVALSVIPIIALQGGIALLSALLGTVIPPLAVTAVEAVGGALIAAVGINLLLDEHIPVGNMLPAPFVALGLVWVLL